MAIDHTRFEELSRQVAELSDDERARLFQQFRAHRNPAPYKLKLKSWGGGLQPGVTLEHLENSEKLRDLMDELE